MSYTPSSRPPRRPQIVEGSRNNALRILKITPDEQTAFVTYLNYAVNNLSEVAGVAFSDERKVRADVFRGEPADIQRRISRLADFLWSFREKDPSADESGYKAKLGGGHDDMAVWLTEKIVSLRNFFSHVNRQDCTPLVISHDEYVFVEGILGGAARDAAMGPGLNPAKAQKLKLATHHVKEAHTYEFTRKGLVFLTCLGLYKDEAEEFCHLFHEMKVPDRIEDADLDEELPDGRHRAVLGLEDLDKFAGLKGKGRALIELFSFYSYRRGRQSLDAANLDFMQFADVVGCLNKVPAPAFEYLPLEKEHAELEALKAASTESEENKRTKYVLRRRDRNRFLSFAAAYCEDFGVLPSVRFKRLDVRRTTGRHQYVFGPGADAETDEEESNRVRLNRHYAIRRDAIPFEFEPDRHYGPVRIGALRSAVSATEMRRLLYLHAQGADIDAVLRGYFEAYHRVLERMVNAGSLAEISLDDETFLADFATICGTSPEAFKADPEAFRKFVPESLRRYFSKDAGPRSEQRLHALLCSKLLAAVNRTCDILVRHDALEAWREASRPWLDARDDWRGRIDVWRKANPKKDLPDELKTFEAYLETLPADERPARPEEPRCRVGEGEGEITNPPTWCRFSDADYVSFVFDWFNLFLPNNRKFRQLPISEQHREGVEDHLFQMVHAAIGKFSLDQKGLWSLLEKNRAELKPYADLLQYRTDIRVLVAPFVRELNHQLPENRRLPEFDNGVDKDEKEIASPILNIFRHFRQNELWQFLQNFRPELKSWCRSMKSKLQDAMEKKPSRKDGKPHFPKVEDLFEVLNLRRPSPTLEDLAVEAVKLSNDMFLEETNRWGAANPMSVSRDDLLAACRRFGVRPGMPVEYKSLLKTVLGIDYDAWRHAFDYGTGRPFADRRLEDEEHVAAQIPLPNGFADRVAASLPRKVRERFQAPGSAAFDFNAAFRAWSPDPAVSLRDFYDVKPLVASQIARKHPPEGGAATADPFAALSAKTLDSAVREIKDAENQDKVLLFVAMKYWERFRGGDTYSTGKLKMPFSEKTTLREFFDTPVQIEKDGLTVSFRPNDVNRPAFATLFGNSRAAKDYRAKIAKILSPDGSRTAFDFYEMVVAFREQKARDRHERLAFTPYAVHFDALCEIPASAYEKAAEGRFGEAKTEAIRAMEFERYKAVLPGLTREDYDAVADARNAVFHTGFKFDCSKAIAVCKRLGVLGMMPGEAAPAGRRTSSHSGPKWSGPRRNGGSRW